MTNCKQPVLCYVKDNWAFFTTQKLSDQWGDDWNDAPYEHNAGEPYTFSDYDKEQGREPWEIVKVVFDSELDTPASWAFNSPWSVEQINAGVVAWLVTPTWSSGKTVAIPAGTPLDEFCRLVKESGGDIYTKLEER